MFQSDVFGYGRNNVFGFNNLGNTWCSTPFNTFGNQTPWNFTNHTPFQMNTPFHMNSQLPFIYNQTPYHTINPMMQSLWNTCQPQNLGTYNYNQGFLPFFGTNLPYQHTTGYFNGGINQGHTNPGQSHLTGTTNPYVNQFTTTTPWGFGSICR